MAKLKIKVGKVEEFTLGGVTGAHVLVEVRGEDYEKWGLGCITPNEIIDMDKVEDYKRRYRFKQGRWDGDWRNDDPIHVEFVQKLLTAANEKLLPYTKALRDNDNGSAVRTPD